MNIQALTPKILNGTNQRMQNPNNSTVITPKYFNTLEKDTVSFSGKGNAIIDAVKRTYTSDVGLYYSEVGKFHQALKKVCKKLEDKGFSFDPIYNSKHPVKTEDGFIDKWSRQGSVADKMRATAYWQNQRDVNSFSEFIKLMDDEGYVVSSYKVLNPETGRLERLPDLEIRQDNINKEDLKILGPFLSKAEISKPRSSTYADWQMRFSPKNKKDVDIELIMLYGENYSTAKEAESKYVYNITRALGKLHIDTSKVHEEKTAARGIVSSINVIKTRLCEDISKPLFMNAKNADLKLKEPKQPVVISKVHSRMLDGYLYDILQKLPLHYKEQRKLLKSDEYIRDLIMNSPEYKLLGAKEVSPQEIKEYRKVLMEQLEFNEAEDSGVIATVKKMLEMTIKKFGEK